jgi:hypothetical protein
MAAKTWGALAAALFLSAGHAAQAADAPPAREVVDYAKPEAWLCRPGGKDACAADMNAITVDAAGNRTPKPFVAAKDPKVDCFYVYPTVSKEPTDFADMTASPEVAAVARTQFARFAARCRVYAPIYRQMTLAGLGRAMTGGQALDWKPAYADVRDAWRAYLANDNHGRGVILIGHSQGSLMLTRLIADEIEGKPAQKLLISALLPGNPGFAVPAGKDVGGTFKSVPVCHAREQIGCVAMWSMYAEDDASMRLFGHHPGGGLEAVCVNPAAPEGGRAPLKAYVRKPTGAPEQDPPWVEAVGQLSAECVKDGQGAALRVRIDPSKYAEPLKAYILSRAVGLGPGWGWHVFDGSLAQGDMLDMVAAEIGTWGKTHP